MTLTIGRRLKMDVKNIDEAVGIYTATRRDSGEGASTFPDGKVRDGKRVVTISYNGRVWIGAKVGPAENEIRVGCQLYTSESL